MPAGATRPSDVEAIAPTSDVVVAVATVASVAADAERGAAASGDVPNEQETAGAASPTHEDADAGPPPSTVTVDTAREGHPASGAEKNEHSTPGLLPEGALAGRDPADPTLLRTRVRVRHAEDRPTEERCPVPGCAESPDNACKLAKHVRTAHSLWLSRAAPEDRAPVEAALADVGFWLCPRHGTVNSLTSGKLRKSDGLFSYRYMHCKKCPPGVPAPLITPPHPRAFATVASTAKPSAPNATENKKSSRAPLRAPTPALEATAPDTMKDAALACALTPPTTPTPDAAADVEPAFEAPAAKPRLHERDRSDATKTSDDAAPARAPVRPPAPALDAPADAEPSLALPAATPPVHERAHSCASGTARHSAPEAGADQRPPCPPAALPPPPKEDADASDPAAGPISPALLAETAAPPDAPHSVAGSPPPATEPNTDTSVFGLGRAPTAPTAAPASPIPTTTPAPPSPRPTLPAPNSPTPSGESGSTVNPGELAPARLSLLASMTSGEGRRVSGTLAAGPEAGAGTRMTVHGVTLHPQDWASLRTGGELKDPVLSAAAAMLGNQHRNIRTLDTLFYDTLRTACPNGDDVDLVPMRPFTRQWRDYGDVDKVLVPIHEPRHWALGVIDLRARVVVFYDPLGPRHAVSTHALRLREWMAAELQDKAGTRALPPRLSGALVWPTANASASWPAQEDATSCGVYVIAVMAALAQGTQPNFTVTDVPRLRRGITLALLQGGTAATDTSAPPASPTQSAASSPPSQDATSSSRSKSSKRGRRRGRKRAPRASARATSSPSTAATPAAAHEASQQRGSRSPTLPPFSAPDGARFSPEESPATKLAGQASAPRRAPSDPPPQPAPQAPAEDGYTTVRPGRWCAKGPYRGPARWQLPPPRPAASVDAGAPSADTPAPANDRDEPKPAAKKKRKKRQKRTRAEIAAGVKNAWREPKTTAGAEAKAKQPVKAAQEPTPSAGLAAGDPAAPKLRRKRQSRVRVGRAAIPDHPPLPDIFTVRVPLLTHIPVGARPHVRDALTNALGDLAVARSETAETHAFAAVFLCLQCLLFLPPGGAGPAAPPLGRVIRARIARWNAGEGAALWAEAKDTVRAKPVTVPRTDARNRRHRAIRLTQEGACRKAITTLLSNGVHAISADVAAELRAKHPQDPAEPDPRFDAPAGGGSFPDLPAHRPFSVLEVRAAIEASPPASAAGASGGTFTHLRELTRTDGADNLRSLGGALARFADRIATGRLPGPLAAWFASAPLTPLRKRDDGVRPIAVGETLRRLVGKLLMRRVRTRAARLLAPRQLGVGVSCGGEAIIHALRRQTQAWGHDARVGLLQIDFRNAFNLVNRFAMRRAVRAHFPELLEYYDLCYMGPPAFLWSDSLRLRSVRGCQQGDPLGPLLFSLALHDVFTELPAAPAPEADNQDLPPPLPMFFIDDGLLLGEHRVLRHYLSALSSVPALAAGVILRVDKCAVWWPRPPTAEVRAAYPAALTQRYSEGLQVLQTHIGSDEYVRAALVAHVVGLAPLFSELDALEDGHVTLTLLRACASVCKVTYLLRTAPPALTFPAAEAFDAHLASSMRRLVGGALPEDRLAELRLPVKQTSPTFGVGLTSAATTAPAAFLASTTGAAPVLELLFPSAPRSSLVETDATRDAHCRWTAQVLPADRATLEEVLGPAGPRQQALTRAAQRCAAGDVPETDLRRSAHRASLGLVGAKDWLSCLPSPGIGTHIPDAEFRLWLRYHCGLRLFNDGDRCPRPGCGEEMDAFGDHLLTCHHRFSLHNAPMLWRHDSVVRVLASILRRASRNATVEPHSTAGERTRPDIRTDGVGGGTDFLDVSIHHPLTGTAPMENIVRCPVAGLSTAASGKRGKYRQFIHAEGPAAAFHPITLSSLGGWLPAARDYFKEVCRAVAASSRTPRHFASKLVFDRVAARLVELNCRALSEGVTTAADTTPA